MLQAAQEEMQEGSKYRFLGLSTHLFVKVSQRGDSEMTFSVFESSYHLLLSI